MVQRDPDTNLSVTEVAVNETIIPRVPLTIPSSKHILRFTITCAPTQSVKNSGILASVAYFVE